MIKFNPLTGNFDLVNSPPPEYTLPTADATTLGGIKVGTRLSITDGVLSADVQTSVTDTLQVQIFS